MQHVPHSSHASRRHFLAASSLAVAGCATTRSPQTLSPNQQIQHACIGVGGMGSNDLRNIRDHDGTTIVALCDVDAQRLAAAKTLVPHARTYRDWRELMAAEGERIDSVNVATPDHMHAAIGLTALRSDKHVYCQKPLCHDVAEVRAMDRESGRRGLVTQLGTQAASGAGDRMAVHYLQSGILGTIQRVILCSNRPGAIKRYRLPGPRPAKGVPPPDHLDWDLWLGTAPERPYAHGIYHPQIWRSWQDFGTGWSGDIGCHLFDSVWKGLDLQPPSSVIAEVQASWRDDPARRADTWPQSNHITWTFPGNRFTESDTLTVEWFDGTMYPPEQVRMRYTDAFPGATYPHESSCVIGTEGMMILPNGSGPILLPREKFRQVEKVKMPPRNHYHHWLDAIHGKTVNESHFQQVGPMTEAILLGTIAIRLPDTRLDWDHRKMRFKNHPEADAMVRRDYRDGWAVTH